MKAAAEILVNRLDQAEDDEKKIVVLEQTRLAWSVAVPQYTPSECSSVATAVANCVWKSVSQSNAVTDTMRERFCAECSVASRLMEILHDVIRGHAENSRIGFFAKCAPSILRYFGIFQTMENQWCDVRSREAAETALSRLLLLVGSSDMGKVIAEQKLFQKVMDTLWPALSRDRWKKSEAERLAYSYMVWNSPSDVLTENLGKILPLALIMTDDIMPLNTRLGISCLGRLVNEIPASELRLFGRAEVIHDALLKKMYTKDPHLLGVLLPCILSSVRVSETDMQKRRGCEVPKHDECFDTMLNNFHLSSDEDVKRVYAKYLPKFTDAMGIHVLGHMKKLYIVLEYSMENTDQQILSNFIEMIVILTDVAWPRMKCHGNKMVKLLVTTLYRLRSDATIRNDEGRMRNAAAIHQALAKLVLSSRTLMKEALDMMGQEECLGLCTDATDIQKIAMLADMT